MSVNVYKQSRWYPLAWEYKQPRTSESACCVDKQILGSGIGQSLSAIWVIGLVTIIDNPNYHLPTRQVPINQPVAMQSVRSDIFISTMTPGNHLTSYGGPYDS